MSLNILCNRHIAIKLHILYNTQKYDKTLTWKCCSDYCHRRPIDRMLGSTLEK